MDLVDTYRELSAGLSDLYMSSVSNRMNDVMRVLTVIATIFIPLTFIAGIYGMNFDPAASPWNMPELGWYWGYPFAMTFMGGIGVLSVIFFRRKGWIGTPKRRSSDDEAAST
jgi:magnesium transporter